MVVYCPSKALGSGDALADITSVKRVDEADDFALSTPRLAVLQSRPQLLRPIAKTTLKAQLFRPVVMVVKPEDIRVENVSPWTVRLEALVDLSSFRTVATSIKKFAHAWSDEKARWGLNASY